MKKNLTLLFTSFLISTISVAQQTMRITFDKVKDTISRKETDIIYPVMIKSKADAVKIATDSLHLYTLTVKSNDEKSTLPKSAYKLAFNSITLDKLPADYTFFVTLNKDVDADKDRHLFLKLEVIREGKEVDVNVSDTNRVFDLVVEATNSPNKYNYLAYVGTNFDLIDGVQPKNLFFATNLFAPPQRKSKGFGFNITLYGNRTITATDTSGRYNYASKIVAINGDSARTYYENALRTVSRVSDNLGASFSPLIRIGSKMGNVNRATQLYYAPQFEFIWRRTKVTTTYSDNKLVDSTDRPNRTIRGTLVLNPSNETIPFNVYDIYLGVIGALLKHENNNISIRVQSSLGLNFSYAAMSSNVKTILNTLYERKWNIFFYTRAWITEPISGITFGAEVSNNFIKKDSYQPYYNVTFSKAINLNVLGAIFQPISSR